MIITVNVKSGTGNYYDPDGCDCCIKQFTSDNFPIPRIGESIDILEDNDKKRTNSQGKVLQEFHQYLVTNIHYWIVPENTGVEVYVVPIGRKILD